jgi:hypothetical protein
LFDSLKVFPFSSPTFKRTFRTGFIYLSFIEITLASSSNPFQILISPSMQQFIQEWFSPDFHLRIWQPLTCFILTLIGINMISNKSISPRNILLTLVIGYAALLPMRNNPLFGVAALPVLSEQVGS